MFNLISKFTHKSEIRESKDEILVGEIVRAMARQGYPTIAFFADDDQQRVQFRAVGDPLLYSVYIKLDRKTGTGMVSSALLGSKATLTITAEIKNRLSDPDDLIKMYRTDLANLFKLPVIGGIKLNHEMNSIYATQTKIIEIDDYVLKGEAGIQALMDLLRQCVDELRVKLEPYKR
jgi:hypothetical protein